MYSLDSGLSVVSAAAAQALDSGSADGIILTPGNPIEIVQFGMVITTAVTGSPTSGFLATLDLRPLAGSDTGRTIGGGSLGTLTLTNAQVLAAQTFGAANTNGPAYVIMSRPVAPTSGEGALRVNPGQQAVFRVKTAISGGSADADGIVFIVFKNLASVDASTGLLIVTS
jgi:hypothetical protein